TRTRSPGEASAASVTSDRKIQGWPLRWRSAPFLVTRTSLVTRMSFGGTRTSFGKIPSSQAECRGRALLYAFGSRKRRAIFLEQGDATHRDRRAAHGDSARMQNHLAELRKSRGLSAAEVAEL